MQYAHEESLPWDADSVQVAVAEVPGWLTSKQIDQIHNAAKRVREGGLIVEIGSFRGRSTTALALSSCPSVRIFAVDPFLGSDRGPNEIKANRETGDRDLRLFLEQLRRAGVRNRVTHVRASSSDKSALSKTPSGIDVLFIDGAHRYRPASQDIRNWGEKVMPNGCMMIHDSFCSVGVTLAQIRILFFSSRWRYMGRSRSLAEYHLKPMNQADRLRNVLRQSRQLPWFGKNLLLKLLITLGLGSATKKLGHDGSWPY